MSDNRSDQFDNDTPRGPGDRDIPLLNEIVDPASGEVNEIPTLTQALDTAAKGTEEPAEDESGDDTGTSTHTEESVEREDDDYMVELLVQDVINQIMPQLEIELRERLLAVGEQSLRAWLDRRR